MGGPGIPLQMPLGTLRSRWQGIWLKRRICIYIYIYIYIYGFPEIKGTISGLPIIRARVFWGPYKGPPYFGKLPYMYIYIYIYMHPPQANMEAQNERYKDLCADPACHFEQGGLDFGLSPPSADEP